MSEEEFRVEEAIKVADKAIFDTTGRHLSDLEVRVLRGSWERQTYEEIAQDTGYSENYLQRDIGAKLWKLLSDALEEPKLGKSNFREALKRRWRLRSISKDLIAATPTSNLQALTPYLSPDNQPLAVIEPEFPDGQVPLGSAFYVDRPPIELQCYEEILQPGALIRTKALRQMGKTSLMSRVLDYAASQGCQTVRLNLRAERAIFAKLDKFLRWFCANVSRELELQPVLDDYWNEELFGSRQSCTMYFQTYLLEQINSPLALALDEADWVFQYPEIAEEFFSLLREWYEEAKNLDIWQRLRVIVAYSTEVYIPLNIHQSPFNVGLPLELPEFSLQQVQDLAQRHRLDLADSQVKQLMATVGGHPYLVRLALYRVRRQDVTLEQLLQDAPTEAGIYSDHLLRHLISLQESLELRAAFKQVVTSNSPVQLKPMQVYQLQRMGLLQVQGNDVTPRCNLYRQYFCDRL
jgi:hypothetical protein